MAVKTRLTPDALAVKVLYAAIQMDIDVWAACDFVEKKLSKHHVTVPFELREKACTIADRKLAEMDELEALMESNKFRHKRKLHRRSLKEQVADEPPKQMADFQAPPQKPVSLDQVVDRYIVRYERESIPLEGQPNGPGIAPNPGAQPAGGTPSTLEESVELNGLLRFLLEQAPPPPVTDEEPPAEDDVPPDDLGGDDAGFGGGMDDTAGGGEPPPAETTAVVNTPQINLNEFSRSIARLVNNYDALLNPRTIILNRVEAYLKSNYNEGTAKYFMQIMERNYGLNITSIEYPEDKNEFPTTYGVGAFAGGAGGGG